mgnify:CR=1 FL=1
MQELLISEGFPKGLSATLTTQSYTHTCNRSTAARLRGMGIGEGAGARGRGDNGATRTKVLRATIYRFQRQLVLAQH